MSYRSTGDGLVAQTEHRHCAATASTLEHQIDGHLDEIGVPIPRKLASPRLALISIAPVGGCSGGAGRRRCQKRRGHTAVRVAVQAVGPASPCSVSGDTGETPAGSGGGIPSSGSPYRRSSGAACGAARASRVLGDTTGRTDGSTSAETTEPTKAIPSDDRNHSDVSAVNAVGGHRIARPAQCRPRLFIDPAPWSRPPANLAAFLLKRC